MPACLVCSREIPATSPFCAYCGSPNPEATPTGGGSAPSASDVELIERRLQAALGPGLTVEEILGEGGFSVVFAATDRKLSRRIAIKVLRPELTASKSSKQRFVREAESVARLNHPHILPIYFVGEGQGLVYFGMPLVEGETLDARIRRDGRLTESEAVRIGAEIADALAEAHAAGIVHRDIKPHNVMLQGAKARVLVADFGIAKAAAGGSGEAGTSGEKLTGTGVAIGSPHYMSPEQASGSDDVDARTDLYSLGIVLWQMLVGELPFTASDQQAILMQQVTRPAPSLRSRRPETSAALADVIARCLEKNPGDRFPSAEALAHALRALLAAPAPSAPGRRAVALGAAAVIVAAAAVGVALWRGRPGARAAAAPAEAAATTAPAGAAPVIAVLPFSVVMSGDTAQFARAAAGMLTEALALRNGVATVDVNESLSRWLAEWRRITAPLEDNARFAYRLGANQMVIGNYVESGRQFRLSATMYDTHDADLLWRDEVTGPTDSLFTLVDRLAARAAAALCGQPEYNPGNLCFDTGARPADSLVVDGATPASIGFYARVSATGELAEVRVQGEPADAAIASQALAVLRGARFEPARKDRRPVDAWATVHVAVRPGAAETALQGAGCDDPALGVRNADKACYDTRPVPRENLPLIATPAACAAVPAPATVLMRVTATGEVQGAPTVTGRSDCAAFNDAAVAAAAEIAFAPAQKAGRPVAAWTRILVRPAPAGSGR